MNQAAVLESVKSNRLMLSAIVAIALVVATAQWVQARRLVSDYHLQHTTTAPAGGVTLEPSQSSTTSATSKVSVTQADTSQSKTTTTPDGTTQTNVKVSNDGTSVDMTNSTHQTATSGSVESDSGSAISGTRSNTDQSSSTITIIH